MASQGVRNAGRFYESHHNLAKANGDRGRRYASVSEKSPFVTLPWLTDRADETGGRDSIEYRIRVLGQFAEDSGSNLLTRMELEKAFAPRRIIGDDEPLWLAGIGRCGAWRIPGRIGCHCRQVIGYNDFGLDARGWSTSKSLLHQQQERNHFCR